MSSREAPASLRVEVVDEHGGPASARVYAASESGSAVALRGGLGYAMERPFGREAHTVAHGCLTASHPPGLVALRAERGPEFEADEVTVQLRAGERRTVRLHPRRWVDMNDRGWFSGDLHGHRDPGDMPLLMAAEALNIGSVIASHNGAAVPLDTPDWVCSAGDQTAYSVRDVELERLEGGPGAIVGIGVRSQMPFRCGAWSPTDVTVAARIRERGGHVDAEKPFWPLTPALVALGCVDSIGLANNHFGRTWTYTDIEPIGGIAPEQGLPDGRSLASWVHELYHRYLNCGFRLAASGGSASGWMPNPLGVGRTYVRLPSGGFDHRSWFRSLREGHSFATTGPMIELEVDGRGPGELVADGSPSHLQLSAEARSATSLERLQIVRDGEVVAEAIAGEGARSLRIDTELPRGPGGWVCARAFESARVPLGSAHTSPVYLEGRASPARRAADAAFLLRWVDGVADRLRRDAVVAGDAAEMLSILDRARDVYAAMAVQA